MIIGIAGKIGSGKSYLGSILSRHGWLFLDLDKVAHQALVALTDEIAGEFGKEIIVKGELNRYQLGQKVFGVPGALENLEKIMYPWIEKEARNWLDERKGENRMIEGVNLHKTSLPEDMAAIIWVKAPLIKRFHWVIERDGHSRKETITRFRSQSHLEPKLFRGRTETYIVVNTNNEKRLIRSLNRIPGMNLETG